MKWLIEALKAIISYFSVKGRMDKPNNPGTAVTNFLGKKAVNLTGVTGALASLGTEFAGATINEAVDFVSEHKGTLFSMTKNELTFVFGKIFKKGGEFDDEAYKQFLKDLDDEMLVAEIEENALAAAKIAGRVDAKKAMVKDLKHKMAVLARFALAKAISIASHGVL